MIVNGLGILVFIDLVLMTEIDWVLVMAITLVYTMVIDLALPLVYIRSRLIDRQFHILISTILYISYILWVVFA